MNIIKSENRQENRRKKKSYYLKVKLINILYKLIMKQVLKTITSEDVDNMILLKWGNPVESPNNPAFLSNNVIGKVYGIDGSSVRRLYMK